MNSVNNNYVTTILERKKYSLVPFCLSTLLFARFLKQIVSFNISKYVSLKIVKVIY